MLLIGLTGKAGHGKDTLCQAIQRISPIPVWRVAFADALKQEVSVTMGIPVETLEREKNRFRLLLQFWGTEYRRHDDPAYWINKVRPKLQQIAASAPNKEALCIITDVRFPNEVEMIESEFGGKTFRVVRESVEPSRHEVARGHVSENAISYPLPEIRNGNMHQLESEARRVLNTVWNEQVFDEPGITLPAEQLGVYSRFYRFLARN